MLQDPAALRCRALVLTGGLAFLLRVAGARKTGRRQCGRSRSIPGREFEEGLVDVKIEHGRR